MNITIRPALLYDVAGIVQFQVLMAFETENGLKLDPAVVEKGVSAVLDDPGLGQYWLAEIDGELAGCLLTVSEWSDWRNGKVLWIHSVYVQKHLRGKGVFKKLYSHLQEAVQISSELHGLRLYVDKTNISAQMVYKNLGMSCEHYQLFEWMKPQKNLS